MIKGNISAGAKISGNISGSSFVGGKTGKANSVFVKEVEFKNRYEFPNIGEKNLIYVAVDEHAAYIFDDEQNVYNCIGRDYMEIGAIRCGLREE